MRKRGPCRWILAGKLALLPGRKGLSPVTCASIRRERVPPPDPSRPKPLAFSIPSRSTSAQAVRYRRGIQRIRRGVRKASESIAGQVLSTGLREAHPDGLLGLERVLHRLALHDSVEPGFQALAVEGNAWHQPRPFREVEGDRLVQAARGSQGVG